MISGDNIGIIKNIAKNKKDAAIADCIFNMVLVENYFVVFIFTVWVPTFRMTIEALPFNGI